MSLRYAAVAVRGCWISGRGVRYCGLVYVMGRPMEPKAELQSGSFAGEAKLGNYLHG